ncbi:MAG: hypothetical protein ABFD07_09660 [Methanobacterium sp.]
MHETDFDTRFNVGSWILEFDPKVSMRDLKIRMITTNDINFEVPQANFKKYKTELDFLKLTCPDDVITGSFALILYGLINRSYMDIDVLIKDKDRYPKSYYYVDHSYIGDFGLTENRLGYKNHIYRKEILSDNPIVNVFTYPINSLISIFGNEYNFKVDYFQDTDVKYNTFVHKGHTFKIHCPVQIMEQKLKMYQSNEHPTSSFSDKHKTDLFTIFKNINFNIFVNSSK